MTIEGLGKKFQEARLAKNLTLDEAARMTKIRPSRLAEIEADDFSQFPSLAYAKGFLLIYGKFLDVDVTPYMEAFETSEHVTVDGYSYLQDNPVPAPVRARSPVVRRRPSSPSPSSSNRTSLMPLVIGIIVVIVGFSATRLILNLQRLTPRSHAQTQVAQAPAPAPTATATAAIALPTQAAPSATNRVASAPPQAPPPAAPAPTAAPVVAASPPPPSPAASEPEVRRAEPVRPEDLAKAAASQSTGPNRVAIRPLKKTYIKVVVDNEELNPAFERWISPADGTVEFRGHHVAVRVLDRDAVQIKKNGKLIEADNDSDVTVE
jgi:cytoskeleton protein RodZ